MASIVDELADWAENPVLAPDYAWQSQYWYLVLLAPVYRDWAEWEPRDARDFQFDPEPDPELPEPDLPFLFPLFGVASCCCRLPEYTKDFATAGAMGNAATCGNAAESPNHQGSIKGSFLVE